MHDDIKKILRDGVQAPSGENCQPWKFKVKGTTLSIFNVPEADTSLYNSKQKGSYMAHGALIENIVISAREYGYDVAIQLFPHHGNHVHVADIIFTENKEVSEDPLYKYIYERCTNRKDYTGEQLTSAEKKALSDAASNLGFNSYSIVDDKHHMERLGVALAMNERVLFENKKLHDFFYDHILWDKMEEDKAGGFYIETLEFLPHQLKGVKLFKNWFMLILLNKILKVSKMISKENGEKYAKSGACGALSMKGTTNEDYINLGRTMQRVWLTATAQDIAMHPCNGTIYLRGHIVDNGTSDFSGEHVGLIQQSFDDIVKIFQAEDSHVGFIFRMGKASNPTAVAKRVNPVVEYIV